MTEIFQHFEVNREARWPVISRLIIASLAFHAAILATVLYVPGVRDSLNIAALLSRTNYVDRAYTKTQIGEDVRVINLAEKFRYPDGYFATEVQPEPAQPIPNIPFIPSFIAQATPSPAEVVPSPSPVAAELPSPSPSVSPSGSPTNATEASSEDKVEEKLNEIADQNSVVRPSENEVNTRPLKDWLKRANDLKVKGELDLTSQVEITIAANLNAQCKLIDAKVIQKSGDARLVDVAKDMVAAIGDSGMLSFLRDPNKVTDANEFRCDEFPLQMTIKLDNEQIVAVVESQADSPARAAEMAKGYSGLLAIGQLLKRGRDEEMLYKSTKITAEENKILVNFSMPRNTASEMLKKQLPG